MNEQKERRKIAKVNIWYYEDEAATYDAWVSTLPRKVKVVDAIKDLIKCALIEKRARDNQNIVESQHDF